MVHFEKTPMNDVKHTGDTVLLRVGVYIRTSPHNLNPNLGSPASRPILTYPASLLQLTPPK